MGEGGLRRNPLGTSFRNQGRGLHRKDRKKVREGSLLITLEVGDGNDASGQLNMHPKFSEKGFERLDEWSAHLLNAAR